MLKGRYQLLLAAFFISTVGDWIFRLAVPLLIFEVTRSPLSMAGSYAIMFAPYVLVMPFGGVVADRFDRRRVLILGDLCSAGLTGLLALGGVRDAAHLPLVYALVFAIAGVASVYHPTFQSIVPDLVDRADLANANAYLATSENVIGVLGPLAGGTVIAALGTLGAFWLDAASFVASALLITAIGRNTAREPRPPETAHPGVLRELREGWAHAWANPLVKWSTVLFVFLNLAAHMIHGNIVYFLAAELHMTSAEVGVTLGLAGIGAVIGALAAPRLGRVIAAGRLILLCLLLGGLSTLWLVQVERVASVAAVRAVAAGCSATMVVTFFTLRQRVVPPHLLGRTVAVTRAITFATIPLAALLGGAILGYVGTFRAVAFTSATLWIATGLAGWWTPLAASEHEEALGGARREPTGA